MKLSTGVLINKLVTISYISEWQELNINKSLIDFYCCYCLNGECQHNINTKCGEVCPCMSIPIVIGGIR